MLEVGLRDVAITTLTVQIPKLGEQVLCGSALVRGDAEDAVLALRARRGQPPPRRAEPAPDPA